MTVSILRTARVQRTTHPLLERAMADLTRLTAENADLKRQLAEYKAKTTEPVEP